MPVIRAMEHPVDLTALSRVTEKLPVKSIELALDENQAGVPDVARTIGELLNCGSSEHVKLRAAQLAIEFRALGDKKNDNRIIFNLMGNNITLNNLIVQE
jgi:hypothetical protein